ncbi:RNA polymerase subunit sigma-70 [Ktedonobacter robiniae]|uniref:RNA polymerase sigma factor n=1 Tax=Ktedonobacter robiniae TaxID=2778365 RepID=A0ABQ3UXW8_9CHLR|nr:RNA polymerase subunit sigma-70 [Ktedonobacter robiniae]GHO57513.1 RNA polymerase sigma factor [Ktedonobacter robiniae]
METPTQIALVLAAQTGDQKAFETLVGVYRRELLVHCYRMLGSLSDAEDLVQETLLRAWEKRATLTSPESYRAWLYRIATNLCLNRLARAPRRLLPSETHPPSDPSSPAPPRLREPIWLEPFPDDLLADPGADPEDRAERSERITLAFLMALQHLTPVQRAILLLREVLEWEASEVAEWLNLSVPAVNSALQRARRALRQRNVGSEAEMILPRPQLQELLDRYVTLWEQADIPGLVALLREDAWFTMPPLPAWVQGRAAIATLFQTSLFPPCRQWHLLPTRANGCPAFGLYRREAGADDSQLFGMVVLDVEGTQIVSMVAFLELSSLSFFALPPTLPHVLKGE